MKNLYLEEAEQWIQNSNLYRSIDSYTKRVEFVRKYSWSIPNEKAIKKIVSLSPIVEVGAGTGYWASLVASEGGDIIAYDKFPPLFGNNKYCDVVQYFPVKEGDHSKLSLHPDRAMMLSWAPYDNSMGADHISNCLSKHLILIGEGYGGCCGNDEMFSLLDKHFKIVESIQLPNWPGINDNLSIYLRK